jgi:hypothetical protein
MKGERRARDLEPAWRGRDPSDILHYTLPKKTGENALYAGGSHYAEGALMPSACWAESLGGCSDKISREHLVSRSFFTAPSVSVKGLSWCKLEEKTIGVDSAVAKILCERHNNQLSPVDLAAHKFAQVLRQHTRLYTERVNTGASGPYRRFWIDARLLERWMLKTLINLYVGGSMTIGRGPGRLGQPTHELVKAAFGERRLGGGFGMHIASHANMALTLGEHLQMAPLILTDKAEIHGALLNVCGLYFYFNATENEAARPSAVSEELGVDWHKCQFSKRIQKITATLPNGTLSHEILFKWW